MDAIQEQDKNLFLNFNKYSITDLQDLIYSAETREEKVFYTSLLNLKMTLAQEKVIGKQLL